MKETGRNFAVQKTKKSKNTANPKNSKKLENARNELALRAHERFMKSAIKAKITIRDVYGVMED